MEVTSIKLALIDEDKDQPRYQFNEEALEELANSIREIGLLSPIKVRALSNGRYKIIYGNRRYKASVMVGLEHIPCIVSTADNETDIYLEQIAENLTREDFSPIEEAHAFHKLMNDDSFRSSTKLIASKLGKTESYIKNKLELLKFSNAVQKLIVSGTQIRKDCLTEDQLMPLKDLPMEYRDTLALTAAKDELPVSDVKKIAKLFKDGSISDSTKQKLLLKNGSGLIETWSVYEQNRKEKLAREKEMAEKAKLEQKRKVEQQKAQEEQQLAEQKAAAQQQQELPKQDARVQQATFGEQHASGNVSDTSSAATAVAQLGVIGNTNGLSSNAVSMLQEIRLDKGLYIDWLEQAIQQAQQLLNALNNGTILQYEESQQLALDMNIKLSQLQQLWQEIQQASNVD